MTANGNWNLVVATPMGERRATLSLKADGGTVNAGAIMHRLAGAKVHQRSW